MGTNKLFDKSLEYDQMLNKGLALSGEDKYYFIHGRFKDLKNNIPAGTSIKKVLDFGCGIGDSTKILLEYFKEAEITGIDTSVNAVTYANENNSNGGKIKYFCMDEYKPDESFDLCFVNGVFHHIKPTDRSAAVKLIYNALKPGGVFSLFENNPNNPGTKLVMRKIDFDKDAITLKPSESQQLLSRNGFSIISTRFLFYFPRYLSMLRFSEKLFTKIPLGAQYYVLGRK